MTLFFEFLILIIGLHAFDVKKVKGNVTVTRGDQSLTVEKKMKLIAGDLIITSKKSRVQISDSGHRIWIGQKSKFRVGSLASDDEPGGLDLLYGKFRSKVKKQNHKGKYRYNLPTAVAGVRGTEFFAESNEGGDTLCTLEGVVVADLKTGESIEVPAGKGLRINPGGVPRLADNSPFLVDRWVGQTSFDDESSSISNAYEFEKVAHGISSDLSYGAFGWAYYCETANIDRNNATSESNANCLRSHISPFIGYGKKHSVFLRPAINFFNKNIKVMIDAVPRTVGKDKTTLTIAELYYALKLKNLEITVGQQEFEWAGGELLSARRWSPEPMTHLGVNLWYSIPSNWQFEVMATKGQESPALLDGHSQVSLLGVKLTAPKHMGEIYALNAKFENQNIRDAFLFRDRKLFNLGLFSKNKLASSWDYRMSLIQQSHSQLIRANGSKDSANGSLIDMLVGYQTSTEMAAHFSFRYLAASKDFVGIHEDWYELGAAGVFSKRVNIKQMRLKSTLQVNENRQFFLEYISNHQQSDSGLLTYSTKSGSDVPLGSEINFMYNEDFGKLSMTAGIWRFAPVNMSGPDPSLGMIVRLLYHL